MNAAKSSLLRQKEREMPNGAVEISVKGTESERGEPSKLLVAEFRSGAGQQSFIGHAPSTEASRSDQLQYTQAEV